jgi:hypothetical protein
MGGLENIAGGNWHATCNLFLPFAPTTKCLQGLCFLEKRLAEQQPWWLPRRKDASYDSPERNGSVACVAAEAHCGSLSIVQLQVDRSIDHLDERLTFCRHVYLIRTTGSAGSPNPAGKETNILK